MSGVREKLIIDRRLWLRDTDNGQLLGYAGKMCCLGFYCKMHGVTDATMLGQALPTDVKDTGSVLPEWLFSKEGCDSRDVVQLIEYNDATESGDSIREAGIIEIFARNGVEVEFIN